MTKNEAEKFYFGNYHILGKGLVFRGFERLYWWAFCSSMVGAIVFILGAPLYSLAVLFFGTSQQLVKILFNILCCVFAGSLLFVGAQYVKELREFPAAKRIWEEFQKKFPHEARAIENKASWAFYDSDGG